MTPTPYHQVIEQTADVIYNECGTELNDHYGVLTNDCVNKFINTAVLSVQPSLIEGFTTHEQFLKDLYTQVEWLQTMYHLTPNEEQS